MSPAATSSGNSEWSCPDKPARKCKQTQLAEIQSGEICKNKLTQLELDDEERSESRIWFWIRPRDTCPDMTAELVACGAVLQRVHGQFNSTFSHLAQKKFYDHRMMKIGEKSGLPDYWIAFRPIRYNTHNLAISATLPRLCARCRGSRGAARLPDPFPQRSSSGCVWYRYNPGQGCGEVCVPSVRDARLGEIYKCQLCGDLMIHRAKAGQVGMHQIFEDLADEIERLFYTASEAASKKIQSRKKKASNSPAKYVHHDTTGNAGMKKALEWELFLGNIIDTKHSTVMVKTLYTRKRTRKTKTRTISGSSSTSSVASQQPQPFSTECYFGIWQKKAEERRQSQTMIPRLMELNLPDLKPVSLGVFDQEYYSASVDQNGNDMVFSMADDLFWNDQIDKLLEHQNDLSQKVAEFVLNGEGDADFLTKSGATIEDLVDDDDDTDNKTMMENIMDEKEPACLVPPTPVKIADPKNETFDEEAPAAEYHQTEQYICTRVSGERLYTKALCIVMSVVAFMTFVTFGSKVAQTL